MLEAELKKLKMNGGFYGNTNNAYSCMFDWLCTLQITLNGQLFLLMNVEMQTRNKGIVVDMCNTDGISYYLDKTEKEYFDKTNKEWEKITKTELEYVNYELVIKSSINDYLAFYYDKEGKIKIKEKGFYVTKPLLDMSKEFLVIPKVIQKYFLHKYFKNEEINIEQEVKKHSNIYDFCSSSKIDKDYQVIYNGEKVQQLNRYYVSKKGSYLYKKKKEKIELESVLKNTKVIILNNKTEEINDERNIFEIDYKYYINAVQEHINKYNNDVSIDTKGQFNLF